MNYDDYLTEQVNAVEVKLLESIGVESLDEGGGGGGGGGRSKYSLPISHLQSPVSSL